MKNISGITPEYRDWKELRQSSERQLKALKIQVCVAERLISLGDNMMQATKTAKDESEELKCDETKTAN